MLWCTVLCCCQWEEALNHFKSRLSGGGDVFGPLIHKYLLDNKHRVTVVMLPDQTLAAKTEDEERQKLDSIRAQLSEQEVCVHLSMSMRYSCATPSLPCLGCCCALLMNLHLMTSRPCQALGARLTSRTEHLPCVQQPCTC